MLLNSTEKHAKNNVRWHVIKYHYTTQDALNDIEGHKTVIMSSIMGIKFMQPNSAIRKCARVQLIKNGKNLLALHDGCLNHIEDGDVYVIAWFGRKGSIWRHLQILSCEGFLVYLKNMKKQKTFVAVIFEIKLLISVDSRN